MTGFGPCTAAVCCEGTYLLSRSRNMRRVSTETVLRLENRGMISFHQMSHISMRLILDARLPGPGQVLSNGQLSQNCFAAAVNVRKLATGHGGGLSSRTSQCKPLAQVNWSLSAVTI